MTNEPHELADCESEPVPTVATVDASGAIWQVPTSAKHLLHMMISRQRLLGSPLPEGFVAPPGIDLDALLKQLPPRPDTPPTA